jgi:thiamine-phosphate pyrophosphorylase
MAPVLGSMSANSTAPEPRRTERLRAVRVYLIATFDGQPVAGILRAVEAAAAAGAGAVQVRAKHADTAARRALLAATRSVLPAGTLLLVNDDLDAVLDAGGAPLADGVHLGREDAAALAGRGPASPELVARGLAAARERLGDGRLLGTSTRCMAEVRAAAEAGADHAGFGAMAAGASKPAAVLADPAELQRAVAAFPGLPLFPIGGLHAGNLARLRAAGLRRAAIGAGILRAPDPAAATRACLAALA